MKTQPIDLDQLKIATPCQMSWDAMKGDDRTRHCGSCKMNVYNIAGLARPEAEDLLRKAANGERVCLRLSRRADGTIITRDCPTGISMARRAKLRIASFSAAVLAGALWMTGSFSSTSRASEPSPFGETEQLMGELAPIDPPATAQPPPAPPEVAHVLMGKVAAPHVEMGGAPVPRKQE